MKRYLYEFETAIDAGGGGGGEPTGEPVGDLEAAAPPVEAAAAEPELLTREEFDARLQDELDARIAALYQQPQQFEPPIPGATPGPMQLPEFDPFDAESVQAYNDARDQRLLAQIQATIAPVTQTFEQQQQAAQMAAGEAYAQDIIADALSSGEDVTDIGKEQIKPIAERFMGDAVQRYGETPRAAEYALRQAVDAVRAIEKAAAERALAQNANHLAGLAGAPPVEPGTAGIAGIVPGQPAKYQTPDELVRKYAPVVRPAA